ncbi:hypothetical protein BC834DRAFT_973328 [Gloeopeniophorella convolvens]|nr:hypothetical protein BC834DRAFT_973328 [Gloeopeniophorella convolvens]
MVSLYRTLSPHQAINCSSAHALQALGSRCSPPQKLTRFWSFERWVLLDTEPRQILLVLFIAAIVLFVLSVQNLLFPDEVQIISTAVDLEALHSPPARASPSLPTPPVPSPPATHHETEKDASNSVVFALVMDSEASAKEGAILIKSAIMYSTRPLQFHILCVEVAQLYLESRLRFLTHPLHNIVARFYPLSSPPANESPFEVLPEDVEKVIYSPTNSIFLIDPTHLWEEFDKWDSTVAISAPALLDPKQKSLSSCQTPLVDSSIMLLHLHKLRAARLLSPKTACSDPRSWLDHRMDLYVPLSRDWGVIASAEDECRLPVDGAECTSRAAKRVIPKLVHFRRLQNAGAYRENVTWSRLEPCCGAQRRWKAALDYHVGFEWDWLNRGPSSATVDIQHGGESLSTSASRTPVDTDDVR